MTLRSALLTGGYGALRPVLFRLDGADAEAVHERMLTVLGRAGASKAARGLAKFLVGAPQHPVTVAGIRFPGRVGLAAGLDKDGVAARMWAALGFGFAELGTVTGLPQPGNDKPRLFRLPASAALVNRMGFNNHGAAALAARLGEWGVARGNARLGVPLGISIGKTKAVPVEAAVADYLESFALLRDFADYVAVNVSSPNTPGLRSLQDSDSLRQLTSALVGASREGPGPLGPVPIFVKVAPDLSLAGLDEVIAVCAETGVAGLIATNTTLARDGLHGRDAGLATQAGGLSGKPLTGRALEVVRHIKASTGLPVIGSGGIMSVRDAQEMFEAGASLVQLYTGFIYAGPGLTAGINAIKERP